MTAGSTSALGEAGAVGVPPPGRRRFVGQGAPRPPAPQNQSRGGAEGPAPALCALCAPAAPSGTLGYSPVQTIHPPSFSRPQNLLTKRARRS